MKNKKKKVLLVALIALLVTFFLLPKISFDAPFSTIMEDQKGHLLGARIATDGQWRFPKTDSIPERFEKALLTFEDRNFHRHIGVDFGAIAKAIYVNIKYKRIVRGGSTLSMQVARLSRKNPARTFIGKFYETLLAIKLECTSSKKEILKMYASHAPFGGNVVGLEAASWRYFGRSPDKLSWAEAATLAVLPNSPSLIFPGRNQEKLTRKRNRLLKKLYEEDIIDELTWKLASAEPVPGPPHPLPDIAPHLLARAEKEGSKGMRIQSSLNAQIQNRTSEILRFHHDNLVANGIHNAAVLVIDVATGKTMAYCGNVTGTDNPVRAPHVDLITAPRSTGSILKPLLFAMSLNDGHLLPNALVKDVPTIIGGYAPKNYYLSYDGAVPFRKAIARSLNIPAVRQLQSYGIEQFHHNLKALGMTTLQRPAAHYGLSIILGGAEGKLWDLASIYRNMAYSLNYYHSSYGKYPDHQPVTYTLSPSKNKERKQATILNASSIWLTLEAMNEVNRPEEESGWKEYASAYKIAWKTGTSFGHRDAWAIGCTPQHVVAVWAGNADGEGRPKLTGLDAAAPIMFDVFKLLKSPRWFQQPFNDMQQLPLCRESGFKASDICTTIDTIWVQFKGNQTSPCPYHQYVFLDQTETYRVTSDCESISNIKRKSWFVLPPVIEYYYKPKNSWYDILPSYRPDCKTTAYTKSMDIIYPNPGTKIHIPVELDEQKGQTVFEVAHTNPEAKIFWYLDATYVGETKEVHQIALQPTQGKHTLTVMDMDGELKEVAFEILNH
ncbi:penicillin-binding protein 1C [Cytophagaceae bacterium ABcell3]|nr:penicillin-binding protein 1C [Cytophagaceae bacterium ABcell3]